MGFFEKFANAANNFDYEGTKDALRSSMEKKQASLEKRARSEIREKARNSSDETLRYNLERARDNNNIIMVDEIEREMERRGLYY